MIKPMYLGAREFWSREFTVARPKTGGHRSPNFDRDSRSARDTRAEQAVMQSCDGRQSGAIYRAR